VSGDQEAVVDAAKTAFISHHQPAADAAHDDVFIGNGRHDNLTTTDAVSASHITDSSNQSLSNNFACPADR